MAAAQAGNPADPHPPTRAGAEEADRQPPDCLDSAEAVQGGGQAGGEEGDVEGGAAAARLGVG